MDRFHVFSAANKVRRGAIENEVAFFATVTPHDVDHLVCAYLF